MASIGHHEEKKLRIVVMGSTNVGKTTLISQFRDEKSITVYKGTFEEIYSCNYNRRPDLTVEVVEIRNGDSVPTVRKQAVASGDAFILVYSVDDADSFEYIYKLRDLILEEKRMEVTVPIIVVANKLDVTEVRKTPIWEIADAVVTIDWEHKYAEVSANDAAEVDGVFQTVINFSLSVYEDRFVSSPRRMTTPAELLSRIRKRFSVRKTKSFH